MLLTTLRQEFCSRTFGDELLFSGVVGDGNGDAFEVSIVALAGEGDFCSWDRIVRYGDRNLGGLILAFHFAVNYVLDIGN